MDSPLKAYADLMRFAADSGEGALKLAMHIAVPQRFRLELLHLLRLNFVSDARLGHVVEADVLLAPFCIDLGNGYYELDPAARTFLLNDLRAQYRDEIPPRIHRVANFLLHYIQYSERNGASSHDRLWRSYLEIERWVALAFLDPANAAGQLAAQLNHVLETPIVAKLQVGGLATALAVPLSFHRHLLGYAAGVQALANGDQEQASQIFDTIGNMPLVVGTTTLRPPQELLRQYQEGGTVAGQIFEGLNVQSDLVDSGSNVGRSLSSTRPQVFMAPQLPTSFVPRDVNNRLIGTLLHIHQNSDVNVMGLSGSAGTGKTWLACSVCHNERIRVAFPDGILWVTFGQNPNILHELTTILNVLNQNSLEGTIALDIEKASITLQNLLSNRTYLFIFDDVWSNDHIQPFISNSSRSIYLIISRNSSIILAETSRHIFLARMTHSEKLRLFSSWRKGKDVNMRKLDLLAQRLDSNPRLLGMAYGYIGENHTNERVEELLNILPANSEYSSLMRKLVEINIKQFGDSDRIRFTDLLIFPENIYIPQVTIEKFWQHNSDYNPEQSDRLLQILSNRSLIDINEAQSVRIHPVIRAYIADEHENDLSGLHRALLEAHRPFGYPNSASWADMQDNESYLWDYLVYHMRNARLPNELLSTIKNVQYLAKKSTLRNGKAAINDIAMASEGFLKDTQLKLLHDCLVRLENDIELRRKNGTSEVLQLFVHAMQQVTELIPLVVDFTTEGTDSKDSSRSDLVEAQPETNPQVEAPSEHQQLEAQLDTAHRLGEALVPLRRAREKAGVSMMNVAEYFGLGKGAGRKTIAQWESGASIPHSIRRSSFITYLADVLRLSNDWPAFQELWTLFEIYWGWEPLSDSEIAQCGFEKPKPLTQSITTDDNTTLLLRIQSKDTDEAAAGIREARRRVERGSLALEELVRFHKHPYWLVRYHAVQAIITVDPENALELLTYFGNVAYHMTQTAIRNFLLQKYQNGAFTDIQIKQAILLLDRLCQSTQISDTSRNKNLRAIAELRGEMDGSLMR